MAIWGTPNTGTFDVRDLGSSLGETLKASASEAIEDMPTVSLFRIDELGRAQGEGYEAFPGTYLPDDVAQATRTVVPDLPIADARKRVKDAGLDSFLKLSDQPTIKAPALDIMIERATARRERALTMERGPGGFVPSALSVGTSFLVGAIDPLNVASAFIPVVGEARYANMLANAGESLVARAAVRAKLGAIEGVAGQAMVEPLTAWAKLQEGQDYHAGEALRSLMFGGVFGAGLHVGAGGARDVYRARRGEAQYPYNVGEPLEFHTPWDDLQPARPAAAAASDLPTLPEKYPGNLPMANAPKVPIAAAEAAGQPISLANLSDENPVRIQFMANRTGSGGANDFGVQAEIVPLNPATFEKYMVEPRRADGQEVPAMYQSLETYLREVERPVNLGRRPEVIVLDGSGRLQQVGSRADIERYFNSHPRAAWRRQVSNFHSAEAKAFGALDDEAVYGTKTPGQDAEGARRAAFENARQQLEEAGMAPEEAVAHAAMATGSRENGNPGVGTGGPELTFQTAKGSTYSVHADGTTTRDKAARSDAGHEGDSGPKPRTAKTIYVDADVASALSGAGITEHSGKGWRVAIKEGNATLLSWNEKAGKWGASPEGRNIPFTTTPEVGKAPVELWKPADDVPGYEAYRGQHAGNAITELGRPPETVPPPARRPAPVLEMLADLPRQAQEDVMRAAIASVTSGEPVRVMEMLEVAARSDPRIAESMQLMETRGQGRQFHGTSAIELNPSSDHYSTKSYYGQGFYTTDAIDIAHGYSKRGAAKTGERNVFSIEEQRPLKIYDAEKPIDAELLAKIAPDPQSRSSLDDVVRMALDETPKNLRELYDEIRDIGTAEGHSADEIQEIFDAINYNLRDAGFDGMSHTGGLRTNKPAHRVVIYFNPESDLTVNKGSFRDFVQADPDGAAANVVRGPKAARGPRARDERTYSLLEFLADRGGLRPDPEVAVVFGGKNPFVPGFGRLIRDTGMTLDRAREASVHASYLAEAAERDAADAGLPQTRPSETTPSDLLEALDEEARGRKQYRNDYLPARKGAADRDEHLRHLDSEFDHALRDVDIDPQQIPDKQRARVIQMMEREGEKDPLVAWERAVMEEGVDGLENAGIKQAAGAIPGWDVPDVSGPASFSSRSAAPAGPGAGAGRGGDNGAAGATARVAGGRDRAPPTEADWRKLAEGRRPENEPDAIAASRAADALPEPGSNSADPSKRVAAAEKAAADADALYADAEAFLPDELRQGVDAQLKILDIDAKDSALAIQKGAACLAAAFA